MTNHATPQTATRLKQAGFTQPEQKPGQFWYLQNRLYFIVAILTDTTGKTAILYEVCEENRDSMRLPVRLPFSDVFVYAPGIGEIIQAIGNDDHVLGFIKTDTGLYYSQDLNSVRLYSDPGPADALAKSWLNLNKP